MILDRVDAKEAVLESLSFEDIIYSWNFSDVRYRLCEVSGWTKFQAEMGIEQYKNYIYLVAKYPKEKFPPSVDIDEVWHTHILYTKDYINFTNKIFSKYLHHVPIQESSIEESAQMAKAFDRTQALYKQEFGDNIYEVHGKSVVAQKFLKYRNRIRSYLMG